MSSAWSWKNLARQATLSASSAAAGMPVNNLKTDHLAEQCRLLVTTGWIGADLATAQEIGLIALFGVNWSAGATLRIRLSNVALGNGELLDTRVETANAMLLETGSYLLLEDGSRILLEAQDVVDVAGDIDVDGADDYYTGAKQFLYRLETAITARYVYVDIVDSGNADGYLQQGILWIGPLWNTSLGIVVGADEGNDDLSIGTASLGGQTYIDERPQLRVFRGAYDFLTEDEAYDDLQRLMNVGSKRNVVLIPDVDSPHVNVQSICGLLPKQKRRGFMPVTYKSFAFEIRERL